MQASSDILPLAYAEVNGDAPEATDPFAHEFPAKIGMARAELNALVRDLKAPSARHYWTDLLLTWSVAAVSFVLAVTSQGALTAVWLLPCGLATYRMTLFTHELTHLPKGSLPGFSLAWNLLCGVVLLIPSFMYEAHLIHHDRRTFGTEADGEYLAFAATPRAQAVLAVLSAVFAVPALLVRFGVIAPLSVLFPPLRREVLARASALNIDFRALRPVPEPVPTAWVVQELLCFAWCATLALLSFWGVISFRTLLLAASVVTFAVALNSVRVLCAHRYPSRAVRSFADQVLDSNDFPGGLAFLWAPLGLRYHAMHHLFPSLPYHALGEAHRRVARAIPDHSALRQTVRPSLFSALDDVVGSRRKGEVSV